MPSAEFEAAAVKVKTLTTSPSNDNLLELYALFKQATVGNNTTAKPGFLDPKGRAKWDAWEAKKDITAADAEKQYIALVEKLVSA
ncbi:Acyl-CoA-binding domain-containing protein 1 [Podila verticillata]|nr:Acyl-CoA-binding domain-containing protein 1 [Podila verticillata]